MAAHSHRGTDQLALARRPSRMPMLRGDLRRGRADPMALAVERVQVPQGEVRVQLTSPLR